MLHGPWELLECSQHTMRIQTRKTWTHAHLKSCEGAHQTIAEIGMVDILSTWTACRLVTKSILWDPYIHQTNATTPDERYNTRRTLQHQPASQIQWATSRSYAHVKCEILKHKSQNQIAGIEQRCYYILNCDSQYCQYILVPIFLKRSTTWSKFSFFFRWMVQKRRMSWSTSWASVLGTLTPKAKTKAQTYGRFPDKPCHRTDNMRVWPWS